MVSQITVGKSIKVSGELYKSAKYTTEAECRSISGQIEFWAKIGRAAMDNPDLPIDFIRDILIGKATDKEMAEAFMPE